MFNRLIFDHEMSNFLYRGNNRIAQILIHGMSGYIKEEGNFFKRVEDSIDSLSYLPKKKYGLIEADHSKDPFGDGIGRQNIKIGRFIKKFLDPSAFVEFGISDSDLEKFVNSFKSYFNFNPEKLKIIEGEEVKKYYLEEHYFQPDGERYGTLWKSCMRQAERNKFMNLYVLNDVKMLVLFSDCGKVRARALLWEGVGEYKSDSTYKFMDRIYTVYDHEVNIFKKWALENQYLTKWEQNAKSEIYVDLDEHPVKKQLYVVLDKHQISWYPYLDTFKYYSVSRGRFSNSARLNHDYVLIQSDGQLEREYQSDDEDEDF